MPLVFSRYGFLDDRCDHPCDADCGIWLWRSDEPLDELLACASLGPDEMALYEGISSESRRREFLTGASMVSSVLGRRLSHYDNGAPFLIDDDRRISVSHTDCFVAMAVDRRPVGIDMESLSRDVSRVAERMFSAEERYMADDVSLWCTKEAAYKAYGREGIDFKRDIRVSRSERGASFEVTVDTVSTQVACFSICGLIVAVTVG